MKTSTYCYVCETWLNHVTLDFCPPVATGYESLFASEAHSEWGKQHLVNKSHPWMQSSHARLGLKSDRCCHIGWNRSNFGKKLVLVYWVFINASDLENGIVACWLSVKAVLSVKLTMTVRVLVQINPYLCNTEDNIDVCNTRDVIFQVHD